jgi:hypothetical protein
MRSESTKHFVIGRLFILPSASFLAVQTISSLSGTALLGVLLFPQLLVVEPSPALAFRLHRVLGC